MAAWSATELIDLRSHSEVALARLALDLGCLNAGGPLSPDEKKLLDRAAQLKRTPRRDIALTLERVLAGDDPLTEALCAFRPATERRLSGAFYTPASLARTVIGETIRAKPAFVVDAGCGTGVFTEAAAVALPHALVTAIDLDPLSTLLTRARAATLRLQNVRVVNGDFLHWQPPQGDGATAYIGNPPYVRHHAFNEAEKALAQTLAANLDVPLSQLSGLHVWFVLAMARHMRPRDRASLILSAEWIDANYGETLRRIFTGQLPATSIQLFDAKAMPFSDVMTTAIIIDATVGTRSRHVNVRYGDLSTAARRKLDRSELAQAPRWGALLRGLRVVRSPDTAPLSDFFRVSRGVVTGANKFFVLTAADATARGLDAWVAPVLSGAEEIFDAPGVVHLDPSRKVLLDPPRTTRLDDARAAPLADYLRFGEAQGFHNGYICSHRTPWWCSSHGSVPPIVATYMARQPPKFALNPDGLRILNVIHGLHPRHAYSPEALAELTDYLNAHRATFAGMGRTYQGGLEKFEPREMGQLPIPRSLLVVQEAAR